MRGPFEAGERVLLFDAKGRRYLVDLVAGGEFHTHAGVTPHDVMIGAEEGSTVRSGSGARFVVVRPTLSDVVLKMPRGAQVIYPKDLGAILIEADIFPGARVLEAGVGSGALSMTMMRAGADVIGYEIRADFAKRAEANVKATLASYPEHTGRYRVECRDVYEGIDETGLDRVVLDLAEPWRVVPHAKSALVAGGILLAYLPTINQTAQLRAVLDENGFGLARTVEVLQRTWHIEGRSVRPDHQMVGHTGFLTQARLLVSEPGRTGVEVEVQP